MSQQAIKKNLIDYLDLLDVPFKKDLIVSHTDDLILSELKKINKKEILVTNENYSKQAYGFAHLNGANHFVNENREDFIEQLNFSARALQSPELILKNPEEMIFNDSQNIEKVYFKEYNKAENKKYILNEIENTFDKKAYPTSVKGVVRCILDEIYTNSIFNAPKISQLPNGKSSYQMNRDGELPENKKNEIFVYSFNNQLLVGCRDSFGTFDISKIKRKIYECYANGIANSINYDAKGGAGIGTYMVIESSSTFYVATEKNHQTLVMAQLPLKMSNKKRTEIPKNYHFIDIKHQGDE